MLLGAVCSWLLGPGERTGSTSGRVTFWMFLDGGYLLKRRHPRLGTETLTTVDLKETPFTPLAGLAPPHFERHTLDVLFAVQRWAEGGS